MSTSIMRRLTSQSMGTRRIFEAASSARNFSFLYLWCLFRLICNLFSRRSGVKRNTSQMGMIF